MNTYVYFGPKAKPYIIETSTEIRTSLAQGDFGWMSKYFFQDLFTDATRSNEYVKDVDVYLVNELGAWSLLNVDSKLAPDIVDRVLKSGHYKTTSPDGRLVTDYTAETAGGEAGKDDPIVKRMVIHKITYDVSLARDAVISVIEYSSIVLLLALPLVFWLASYLLQKQLLNPLFRLRSQARAIADGDLDQAIADTGRRDEIGNLAPASPPCATPCGGRSSISGRPTPRSSGSCPRPSSP